MAKTEVTFRKDFRGSIAGEPVRASRGDKVTADERFLGGLRTLGFLEGDKPAPEAETAETRETREVKPVEKRGPGRPRKDS